MGPRDLIDREKDFELWERVRRNVETRGHFLSFGQAMARLWGARRNRFPALARKCMMAIWKNMFGGHAYTDEAWSMLFDSKIKAIANYDYLGIPLLEDIEWDLHECARQDDIERMDVRGAGGYLAIWDYLAEQLGTGVCESKTVTRFIHTWSSGHVARLIESAGNVSLASCHPELFDKHIGQDD